MTERDRLSHYTVPYFTRPRNKEIRTFLAHTFRPDQVAALAYAFAVPDFEPDPETDSVARDLPVIEDLWKCQCDAILNKATRVPSLVLDIGCGRGELLAALIYMQVTCIGIDPSPGAVNLVPGVLKEWIGVVNPGQRFQPLSFHTGLRSLCHLDIDTILFVESIEHIPTREFVLGWPLVCKTLDRTGGICILTNWVDFWPIKIDGTGYDHISLIDDRLYDRLSRDAKSVIYRRGSHLVLQF